MCGIVGYRGEKDAGEKVVEGLKKVEYRGYDSAGIAVTGNPSIQVEKGVGTIDEVVEEVPPGHPGIGHTRWATHGEVNQENAHPHTDCSGDIAVVHNGIIDNHEQLRQELEGHEFRSETDTEVIPHLVEEELEKGRSVVEAAENVMDRLEGSYAVVVSTAGGDLFGFKKGSPLSVGAGDGEYFLASDTHPFLEYTERAVFLEDGDVAVLDDGGYSIYNGGSEVEREVHEIDWEPREATKSGYDHFMEKEIEQQPNTFKRAVFQDRSDMEEASRMVEDAEKVYITGCGSAGIAASLGAKYLRDAGVEVETELAHELEYRKQEIGEDDLVVAVSQSGETADLLSVTGETDARVLGVINVVGSTLAREADHALFVNAGPEIGVASTKAFTGQLAVLKLLKYALEGDIDGGREELIEAAGRIGKVLEWNRDEVEDLSEYFSGKDDVYFIGRNTGYEAAREASLKLKELSYIHSEAFPGGEFKHGTLALVEQGTPVVSFIGSGERKEILSNTEEARGRGADIVAVGEEKPWDDVEYFLEIPAGENTEILSVVLFQLVAYRTAVKLGHNPDKPRNLAKSVTVK